MNSKVKISKGFTLIELLLVVGFISLAGIGIYTIYSKVQISNVAMQEAKNLDILRTGVKTLFGGQQNYAGLSNAILNDARITPDSMRKIPYVAGDVTITNSFGGAVVLYSTTNYTYGWFGGSNAFYITYANVPGAVCAKLATGAGAGWDQIIVGGSTVKSFRTGNFNISTLATACAGDSGSGVSMSFFSL